MKNRENTSDRKSPTWVRTYKQEWNRKRTFNCEDLNFNCLLHIHRSRNGKQKVTNRDYFDLGHYELLEYFDQGHCERRQKSSPRHHRRHSDTGALLTMVQISSLSIPVTIRL